MQTIFNIISSKILPLSYNIPFIIAVDGIDASGKTTFANEFSKYLHAKGRDVIRISIDDFHNPKEIRYAKGRDSPKGYFLDSFNYTAFLENTILPLKSGKLRYKERYFSYITNSRIKGAYKKAQKDSIIIVDGIFLLRDELIKYWDFKIFLDINIETSLQRAIKRDTERDYLGSRKAIIRMYKNRYIPAQKYYLKIATPKTRADLVIDNNDYISPVIV